MEATKSPKVGEKKDPQGLMRQRGLWSRGVMVMDKWKSEIMNGHLLVTQKTHFVADIPLHWFHKGSVKKKRKNSTRDYLVWLIYGPRIKTMGV